jgi:hypothetical protein
MTIKYLAFDDDKALAAKLDAINADYLAAMAQKLGRAPGETIDSVINPYTGEIIGPADSIITVGLVEALTFEGVAGGLVPVDDALIARETVDPAHAADAKADAELDPKWQAELDAKAADAVAADVAEPIDPREEVPADGALDAAAEVEK